MSHAIDMTNGQANVALRGGGKSAWHGLGQAIESGDSIDVIARKAGLDFQVLQAPMTFVDGAGNEHEVPNARVNYRSDSKAVVGTVSASHYNVVQPREVVEFFADFCADNQLPLETAGSLRGGSTVWALAKLGKEFDFILPGNDRIDGYLRLQTSFDGTRATDAVATTIRQVCANTEAMINSSDGKNGYRTPHSAIFDAKGLQRALGLLGEQYKVTSEFWNALVKRKVSAVEREKFFCDLFSIEVKDRNAVDENGKNVVGARTRTMLTELNDAYVSGPGATLKSAKGTAYGLLQAVTYWTDHKAGSIDKHGDGKASARLNSAWFGLGQKTKQDAEFLAAELAGCVELIAA